MKCLIEAVSKLHLISDSPPLHVAECPARVEIRIRQNVWRTVYSIRGAIAEHLKSKKIGCEVPLPSGALERDLRFSNHFNALQIYV